MISEYPLTTLSAPFIGRPAKAVGAMSAPLVTLDDVLGALNEPWSILPGYLAALTESLPALVGCSAVEAREQLGALTRGTEQSTKRGGAVAILPIFGIIFPRGSLAQLLGFTTAERIAAQFRELARNPNVSAIILDVDSPGGVVQGIDELSAEIYKARGQKPIIAVANHQALSATYWIATAADELVVTPSGEIGSIGVFAAHEDRSKAMEMAGLKVTLVGAGQRKLDGNPFEPLSNRARSDIQERVNAHYSAFVAAVARNRGTNVSMVRSGFGEGRTVGAREAVKLRMVDRIDTLEQVVGELSGGKRKPLASGQAQTNADFDFRRRRARAWNSATDDNRTRLLLAEVEPGQIPALTFRAACEALALCRRELDLPTSLHLRWFDADADRYTQGLYLPHHKNEIWLSSNLSPGEARMTVAHEARHAWQYIMLPENDFRLSDSPEGQRQRDRDAEQYMQAVQARYWLPNPHPRRRMTLSYNVKVPTVIPTP